MAEYDESPWWHRPGQFVVCRNARKVRPGFPKLVEKKVYCIDGVTADSGNPHFALVEIPDIDPNDNQPYRYISTRFRPVTDISIEKLKKLLSPTPKQAKKLEEEKEKEKELT